MNDLARYIRKFVEPTVDDFKKNPHSARHAFLSCVVTYHAIDRVSSSPGNLRKEWAKESPHFKLVDIVAHHFKHVKSGDERRIEIASPRDAIPVTFLLGFNDTGDEMELRNLYFVVQEAVKFLHKKSQ